MTDAGVNGTFVVALGTEDAPYTKQIDAVIFGDWAVHGVFRKDDPTDTPSSFHFTVSHVHTGRRLPTFGLTRELATSLAHALAELGPVPTWEVAKEKREAILAFVDAVDSAMCEQLEASRVADEETRGRLERLLEERRTK